MKKGISNKTISVIGLGKLGAPLAVAIASRSFKVIGVDVNKKNIQAINSAKPHLNEPQYSKLLKKNANNLNASSSFSKAIKESSISFIVVPTPSQKNGSFSNKFITQAIKAIGRELKNKSTYHLISIVSTLSPQSMTNEIKPALEKTSLKRLGVDVGLCYSPSFIALGNVISNLLKPDFVLIGQSDKLAGDLLEKFYQQFCTNSPPIKRMNWINAEISKLALNTFVTTKISYANMLSQLCAKLPQANAHIITQAIGIDSRIGLKYLSPGPPFGGPCFPRDNQALITLGKKIKVKLPLAQATDSINTSQLQYLAKLIISTTPARGKISILGLSYKENTDVIDEAAGIKLTKVLAKKGYQVTTYDPLVKFKSQTVHSARSISSCIKNAHTIVITTRDKVFSHLPRYLAKLKQNAIVIDCWSLLPLTKLTSNIKVKLIGQNYAST